MNVFPGTLLRSSNSDKPLPNTKTNRQNPTIPIQSFCLAFFKLGPTCHQNIAYYIKCPLKENKRKNIYTFTELIIILSERPKGYKYCMCHTLEMSERLATWLTSILRCVSRSLVCNRIFWLINKTRSPQQKEKGILGKGEYQISWALLSLHMSNSEHRFCWF